MTLEQLKFKIGDKVRVKSLEWYNENKDAEGNIINSPFINFVKDMARFCGQIFQIKEIEHDYYFMHDNGFCWQDWMLEDEVVEDIKKRALTKEVAQAVVRCTKYLLSNENENANLQKKLFEIGCKWASGSKEVANEDCKYLYVDKNLNITMGDAGEVHFYKEVPSAEFSVNDVLNIEIKDITMETKEMTQEEVFEYLNNTKILCISKEESQKVQEKLFELGLKWKTAEKQVILHAFLFIIVEKKIQFTNSMEWWVKSSEKQIDPNEILAIKIKEKPKFDPATLRPFDKVLVRDEEHNIWKGDLFSHLNKKGDYKFICVASLGYKMCIPYNDETKNLIGTTNEAPEFYRI